MLVVVALALIVAAVLWALLGPAGSPAACRIGGCDCERIADAPIRQPVLAWTGLLIALVGTAAGAAAGDARRGAIAIAIVVTGTAAFLAHALATETARALDGAAVAALASTVVAAETRWHPGTMAVLVSAPVAAFLLGATTRPLTALLIGAALWSLVRNRGGRNRRWAGAAAAFFGVGGLAWWAGGGPWCDPHAAWQWHAVWHGCAAAGLGAAWRHIASGPEGGPLSPDQL